ncbi:hypothetical protein [Streptomyces johnsoniae]|uniref:Integral membrane protein n=1 Tax=Streptomyces johnsoniae TaxID=3075532 RepID=A0ABU2S2Q5_9ACTN|nr:hypothetical protein [Streptomyces sp. DSM 41886]MDT0442370.1 hypothetical protein [Streptomyces sp. DSM 41886]
MAVSTRVDAEQAWKDLQRIRVPQERVYDEVERCASGTSGTAYPAAVSMWLFLVGMSLDLPPLAVCLVLAAYVALVTVLAVAQSRRSRMQLHRSRYNRRTLATYAAGGVGTGGTALLTGSLAEPLGPVLAGLVQATASTAVFLLFIGPVSRWAAGSLRGHGERAGR